MVFSKDGTRIAFDKAGSGPPVILVGGAAPQMLCSSSNSWVTGAEMGDGVRHVECPIGNSCGHNNTT